MPHPVTKNPPGPNSYYLISHKMYVNGQLTIIAGFTTDWRIWDMILQETREAEAKNKLATSTFETKHDHTNPKEWDEERCLEKMNEIDGDHGGASKTREKFWISKRREFLLGNGRRGQG
jgi:hypothetical protein